VSRPSQERLGPFLLERLLGENRFTCVHEAMLEDDKPWGSAGTRVALKTLGVQAPAFVQEAFDREATAFSGLRHDGVARVLEQGRAVGTSGAVAYVARELVEGRSLRDLIDELGALPDARVRDIGRQLAGGLAAIHAAGLVHGDVKPANVVVTPAGRAVLVDAGIGVFARSEPALERLASFSGSLAHAAPELLAGAEPTPRTDLYALGIVMLEALTGVHPFVGADVDETLRRQVADGAPRAGDLARDVTPLMDEVVAWLVTKDEASRAGRADLVEDILRQGTSHAWWAELMGRSSEVRRRVVLRAIPTSTRLTFRGRSDLVAELVAHVRSALRGSSGPIVIEAAGGMGKSRLLREVISLVLAEESRASAVVAPLASGADALRSAVAASLEPLDARLPALLGGAGSEEIAAVRAVLLDPTHPSGPAAISRVLVALAVEAPLLLVLDDIHAADSLAGVVAPLVDASRSGRLVVLAATRPGSSVARLLAAAPGARHVLLAPLELAEIEAILTPTVREHPRKAAALALVARASEGSPLMAELALGALEARGVLERHADGVLSLEREASAADVAGTGSEWTRERMQSLPESARELLADAALLGMSCDLELLAHVAQRSVMDLAADLQQLSRFGFLATTSDGVRFDHALVRDAVRTCSDPASLPPRHARAADAIERRCLADGSVLEASRIDLAGHLLAAGDWTRARFHLLALARTAGPRVADERLASLIEPGLSSARAAGDAVVEAALGTLDASRLAIAGRPDLARDAATQALAIASGAGDELVECLAEFTLAFLECLGDRLPEGAARLARCVPRLAELDAEAGFRGNLALQAALVRLGDLAPLREAAEQGIRIASAIGDPAKHARARMNLAIAMRLGGEVEGVLPAFLEAEELACRAGDVLVMARTRHNIGNFHFEMGDVGESGRWFALALDTAERAGDRLASSWMRTMLARVAVAEGELELAERHCLRGLDPPSAPQGDGYALVLSELAWVRRLRSNPRGGLEAARAAMAVVEGRGVAVNSMYATLAAGACCFDLGDRAEGLDLVRRGLERAVASHAEPEAALARALLALAGELDAADVIVPDSLPPFSRASVYGVLHAASGSPVHLRAAADAVSQVTKHLDPARRERAWAGWPTARAIRDAGGLR